MGEHTLEATSRRVQGRFSRADEEWGRCYGDLMTQARARLIQEVGVSAAIMPASARSSFLPSMTPLSGRGGSTAASNTCSTAIPSVRPSGRPPFHEDTPMAITIDTGSRTYLRRLIGAAALDRATYEDVECDETATSQAFATVILSGLAAGVGALGFGGTLTGVAFMATTSVLTWGIWAVITFEIGVNLMPRPETRSDVGELLRTLGFATAPGCVLALGVIPMFTIPVFAVTAIWLLASMTVAVRQALDVESTGRALAVCTVGWLLVVGLGVAVGLVFGPALA